MTCFQSYLDNVDWTDPGHVRRAVRVFEVALRDFEPEYLDRVAHRLERDGYKLENGRITGGPVIAFREGALATLSDPATIREHLDRIARPLRTTTPRRPSGQRKS